MRGALVRLYWRELLSFLLFLLPIVTLLPLGLLWLYQSGYEFAWLGFLLLCGLAAAPFLWRLRREAEPLTGVETQADPLWGQAEAEAWASEVLARSKRPAPRPAGCGTPKPFLNGGHVSAW